MTDIDYSHKHKFAQAVLGAVHTPEIERRIKPFSFDNQQLRTLGGGFGFEFAFYRRVTNSI